MNSPYRTPAEVPKYPKHNSPIIRPQTNVSPGCMCCDYYHASILHWRQMERFGLTEFDNYHWCGQCLNHYATILQERGVVRSSFSLYCKTTSYYISSECASILHSIVIEYQLPLSHTLILPIIRTSNAFKPIVAVRSENVFWSQGTVPVSTLSKVKHKLHSVLMIFFSQWARLLNKQ